MSFYFAVDLSPMFPDTLMVGMEIRLKVGTCCISDRIKIFHLFNNIVVNAHMLHNFAVLYNLCDD